MSDALEVPINWHGKSYETVFSILQSKLIRVGYTLDWQLNATSVIELPTTTWLNGRTLTLELINERNIYVARQRKLMSAVVKLTERELKNGI